LHIPTSTSRFPVLGPDPSCAVQSLTARSTYSCVIHGSTCPFGQLSTCLLICI
jgi:hypothetical protein